MANTRNDTDRDFDYVPRAYDDAAVPSSPQKRAQRPLTGRAALAAAKRREAAEAADHIMPMPADLRDTSREQLDHSADMIRRIRTGEPIGHVAAVQVVEVLPEQLGLFTSETE